MPANKASPRKLRNPSQQRGLWGVFPISLFLSLGEAGRGLAAGGTVL